MASDQDTITALTSLLAQTMSASVDIQTPSTFNSQVSKAKEILKDDCTGLISPIIDFMINSVCDVEFSVETDNDAVNEILNKWMRDVNITYKGKIPTGLRTVVREYASERWTSGLTVSQVTWQEMGEYAMPMSMVILDGQKVKVKGKTLNEFTYEFNSEELTKDYYVHKLGRILDAYPTPYLIRKVYKNWAIKHYLKKKGAELIQQVLIYLALLKKGDKNNPTSIPGGTELDEVLLRIQAIIKEAKQEGKTPMHLTGLDAELEHIIPDLEKALKRSIYEEADRDILSGLGLIDIVQGIGSTRKESILNPKPLMQEVFTAVKDFKMLLLDVVKDIVEKNKTAHGKYFGEANLKSIRIVNTPVKSFWTDDFLSLIRTAYDRGLVDYKTYIETFGFDFQTIYKRKLQDLENGLEVVFYPPVIMNQEATVSTEEQKREDIAPAKPQKPSDEEDILDDRKSEPEKNNFKSASLEGAPYQTIEDINKNVRDSIADKQLLDAFRKAFNSAWKTYADKDEAIRDRVCMRVAWKQVKLMGFLGKDGKWHIKDKYAN